MRPNEDPLDTAEALMAEEDANYPDPGLAVRAALLIGLDIARSLRNIYYSLERMNP